MDLLDAATFHSNKPEAQKIALWISEKGENLVPAVEKSIARALGMCSSVGALAGADQTSTRDEIRFLKRRVAAYSRDSISACELSRLYTVSGQRDKAEYWLKYSVNLSPNNRYVLRSLAQFYTHIGVPEVALDFIWRSDAVRFDPWIQSAEVAVADSANRTPKWALKGMPSIGSSRRMDLSELAVGLASLQEKEGAKRRYVKQLLNSGLENPTENALSQAVWIKTERGFKLPDSVQLSLNSFVGEVRARSDSDKENYDLALAHCKKWMADEPYSVPALDMAASLASTFLGRYDEAILYYEAAMKLNPRAPLLTNGLLVAHAYNGDLEKAEDLFSKLSSMSDDASIKPYLHAARGLIDFRRGNIESGRAAYREAVNITPKGDQHGLGITALIYWIDQEIFAQTIGRAEFQRVCEIFDAKLAGVDSVARVRAGRLWRARKLKMVEMFEKRQIIQTAISNFVESTVIGFSKTYLPLLSSI